MNFDQSFTRLIGHEGGYSMDSRDPGGETKYGISRKSYPGEDIEGMTLERAKAIYLRDYWGPAGCDVVPEIIRFGLFDMAVNSGVKAAIRTLQQACGADPDGVLGPVTLMRLQSLDRLRLHIEFNARRLEFYASLPTWPAFGRGWARRVASNMREVA